MAEHSAGASAMLHTHSTTFLHTRALSSSHRSILVRPWSGPVQHNTQAQLDEYDERLRLSHQTLLSVQEHCHAARHYAPPEPDDTAALRDMVNQDLGTQVAFFTAIMARWSAYHEQRYGYALPLHPRGAVARPEAAASYAAPTSSTAGHRQQHPPARL